MRFLRGQQQSWARSRTVGAPGLCCACGRTAVGRTFLRHVSAHRYELGSILSAWQALRWHRMTQVYLDSEQVPAKQLSLGDAPVSRSSSLFVAQTLHFSQSSLTRDDSPQIPRASVVQQQQDSASPGKDVDIRVQATKRIKSLGEAGRAREAVSELAQMARWLLQRLDLRPGISTTREVAVPAVVFGQLRAGNLLASAHSLLACLCSEGPRRPGWPYSFICSPSLQRLLSY